MPYGAVAVAHIGAPGKYIAEMLSRVAQKKLCPGRARDIHIWVIAGALEPSCIVPASCVCVPFVSLAVSRARVICIMSPAASVLCTGRGVHPRQRFCARAL